MCYFETRVVVYPSQFSFPTTGTLRSVNGSSVFGSCLDIVNSGGGIVGEFSLG